jgi:hypothetical protein
LNGKCEEWLCHPNNEKFACAADAYIADNTREDPVIGKMVKISQHGFVSFKDQDGDNHDHELNLNWKRLRNMTKLIVDFQLSKIAFKGSWKTKSIRTNLGTFLLDNMVNVFNPSSYHEMEKNDKKDMEQCEVAWHKKIGGELMKRGWEKIGNGDLVKRRKTNEPYLDHVCAHEDKENEATENESENKEESIGSGVLSTLAGIGASRPDAWTHFYATS